MTRMLERAVAAMVSGEPGKSWTLNDLREAAAISIRAQYRLCQELLDDGRVIHYTGNVFYLRATAPAWLVP